MSGELCPPSAAREAIRPITSVVRCRKGAVALEFILVSPVLLFLLFAILYLGIALNDQLMLTLAAEQGAEKLATQRGALPFTPYTNTTNFIQSAAINLTTTQITQTFTVGGSPCSSDTACPLTQGQPASVALMYPCDLTFMGWSFGGSPCTLYATSVAIVQ
jgi:Flp pilus assembly protein TadG